MASTGSAIWPWNAGWRPARLPVGWCSSWSAGGRRFQCGIDLTDGKATMRIGGLGDQEFAPTAPTPLGRPGKHTVMFCNVDDQLRLLVDGNEIQFNALTIYDSRSLRVHVPTPEDLSPVGIGAEARRSASTT